ncbi:MAG: FtsW/RodA/SpoVE family cell cycle protein [Prevotellaceae bacterium]|jgi:cell division protein FtsW|nr:FtsW/RodA/SpoVE family cell cycle protein [Prevotellaceae bacterium]
MKYLLSKIHFGGDKIIWRIIIFLFLFSVLAIFSTSNKVAAMDGYRHSVHWYLINRHLVFFVVGLILMFIFHRIPISVYKNFATLSLIVSIGLLVYLLLFGKTINGATRWISVGVITFHPVEVAKISVVLYLASVLEDAVFDDFKDVLKKIVLPIGTICILTFTAGISMGLLLGIICMSILFVGGLKLRYLFKICGLAIAGLVLLVAMGLTVKWPSRVATGAVRIVNFLGIGNSNTKSADDATYDVSQPVLAKMAVASGGFVGKGPGRSVQRYLLPHADSDFVFAIIIEEYGLIIGILLLIAYMALLYRAVIIAKKCTRIFSSVTVLGLMLMIVFQAMLNMAVSVGVFPVTGQTLPFISRGGTSILCTGIAFGIILSVSRAANIQEISQKESDTNEKYIPNDTNEKKVEYNG